jgi:hypothetical protein
MGEKSPRFCPVNTAFTLRLAALAAVLSLALPVSPARASEPLATLGTNDLTVSESEITFSQTATTLTINPSGVGKFLFGQFADSYNWSGVSSLGLFLSAPDGSPNASFKVVLLRVCSRPLLFCLSLWSPAAAPVI